MGLVCSVDTYKEIRQNYAYQFSKMVIDEKGKLFLDRMVGKLQRDIKETALKCESNSKRQLEQKQSDIEQYFAKVSIVLDDNYPGGVKSLQQMSNKPVEDLMGLNYIKRLMNNLKNNISANIRQEERKMMKELEEIQLEISERVKEERPLIKAFDNLAESQKEAILRRGQIEFHKEIIRYQQYILHRYGEKLERQSYIKRFNTIEWSESLQKLSAVARDKFVTCLNLLLSQTVDSYRIIK